MTTFIIITTTGFLTAEGNHWTRSVDGEDVYVYPDSDAADPVAEVDADEFITIFDRDAGEFVYDTDGDDADIQALLGELQKSAATSE
ncbi:hypothetical protein U3A55_11880 [Salarchaeum sp. III]|uniref:hypothetical protein n=1 Tax=Salarchaeum sp. III TaxID=3107927 RepID=UPI002ED83200